MPPSHVVHLTLRPLSTAAPLNHVLHASLTVVARTNWRNAASKTNVHKLIQEITASNHTIDPVLASSLTNVQTTALARDQQRTAQVAAFVLLATQRVRTIAAYPG